MSASFPSRVRRHHTAVRPVAQACQPRSVSLFTDLRARLVSNYLRLFFTMAAHAQQQTRLIRCCRGVVTPAWLSAHPHTPPRLRPAPLTMGLGIPKPLFRGARIRSIAARETHQPPEIPGRIQLIHLAVPKSPSATIDRRSTVSKRGSSGAGGSTSRFLNARGACGVPRTVDCLAIDRPATTQFLVGVPESLPSLVVLCTNSASARGETTFPYLVLYRTSSTIRQGPRWALSLTKCSSGLGFVPPFARLAVARACPNTKTHMDTLIMFVVVSTWSE